MRNDFASSSRWIASRPVFAPPRQATASVGALLVLALGACGGATPTPRLAGVEKPEGSPLGASYVLLPLPTEDDALLGRVLERLPEPGRSLEESTRPNACADKLAPAKTSPLASTFEDAQDLSVGGQARAMLGTFGFSADARAATHFFYKIEAQKRVARADTTDYVQCCKDKGGCGYGFVSALVYGEGEYATADEQRASVGADVIVAGGSGNAALRVIHKRRVRGWMAALVTVTDAAAADKLGPLGVAAAAGITEASAPEQVKAMYEADKLSVEGDASGYAFKDAKGDEITENEFVRRYRDVTGARDLDDVERRRNTPALVAWGALTAASAGVMVYGLTRLDQPQHACQPDDWGQQECASARGAPGAAVAVGGDGDPNSTIYYNSRGSYTRLGELPPGAPYAFFGGLGALGFGFVFGYALAKPDGSAASHYLTNRDARVYVQRYNRALLRRSIRDVERGQTGALTPPAPAVAFRLAPGPGVGLGAALTF